MNNVREEICEIIASLFSISGEIVRNNVEKSLFVHPFNLKPTELLYLYFYLEKKYRITLSEIDVIDYSFTDIRSITTIINSRTR